MEQASPTSPPAAPSGSGGKRKFGFWSIVLLTVNGIIGTGIFLSPAGVVKVAGIWTPLVYVLAGIFAIILALTFASAAKYVTKNGASYAYAKAAFGPDLGFYVGITRFVAAAIAWGVMATAVVRTTLGIFGGSAAVTGTNITIGFVILMAILLGIVLSGTYVTKLFSNISTLGKIFALVVAIGAGLAIFLSTGQNHFFDLTQLTDAQGQALIKPMDVTIFVGAVLAAFYAYTGFESVASAASEMDRPERNLPRAIPLAIGIVVVIYVGVVSIAMVINPEGLLRSTDAVILASAFSNPIVSNTIIYGAVVSMFGINVAAAFSTPYIFEAMAAEGQIPRFMCQRTRRGVPLFAFLVTAAVALVIPMAFAYDMRGIMIISSVSRFVQFLVVPIGVVLFYLGRSREHTTPGAMRSRLLDIVVPVLAFASSLFLLIKFDWVGQFSTKVAGGTTQLNGWAIWAMIIGYVVLPIALYVPYRMGLYRSNQDNEEVAS